MSVKAMAQVWDMKLPQNEKFVLLAYADHAAHDGTSIYPAISTVAEKTGYSERSVQAITRILEEKGLLIDDGKGPKGTNKWRLGVQNLHPAESAPVQSETDGGEVVADDGGEIATAPEPSLTVLEPSLGVLSKKLLEQANAKVTAIIEQSRHQKYPNREKIPEPYLAYADAYNELTGQEPTKRVMMDWLGTFSDWQGEGIQVHHVRAAFEQAKNRFPVIRPGSLTNLAAAIRAQGKTKAAATEYHDPMDHLQRAMALHAND